MTPAFRLRLRAWLQRHPALKTTLKSFLRRHPGLARGELGLRPALRGLVWRGSAALGLTVARDDVLWCYRTLLDREPESETAVLAHAGARNFRQLVDSFTRSPEYLMRLGRPAPESARVASAITAEDFRRSVDIFLAARPPSAEQRHYIDTHFERLLHTLNVLQNHAPLGAAIVDYSAAGFFSHAVRQLVGHVSQASVTGVNFERDDYAARLGEQAYDLCVNTEVLEHLAFDPAWMIWSINRMLKPEGLLFLSTPNAVSMANALRVLDGHSPALWNQFKPDAPYYERHNREWSPSDVQRLLEANGFEIVQIYTRDFYPASADLAAGRGATVDWLRRHAGHGHFGDTLCVLARRVKAVDAPVRDAWLYA